MPNKGWPCVLVLHVLLPTHVLLILLCNGLHYLRAMNWPLYFTCCSYHTCLLLWNLCICARRWKFFSMHTVACKVCHMVSCHTRVMTWFFCPQHVVSNQSAPYSFYNGLHYLRAMNWPFVPHMLLLSHIYTVMEWMYLCARSWRFFSIWKYSHTALHLCHKVFCPKLKTHFAVLLMLLPTHLLPIILCSGLHYWWAMNWPFDLTCYSQHICLLLWNACIFVREVDGLFCTWKYSHSVACKVWNQVSCQTRVTTQFFSPLMLRPTLVLPFLLCNGLYYLLAMNWPFLPHMLFLSHMLTVVECIYLCASADSLFSTWNYPHTTLHLRCVKRYLVKHGLRPNFCSSTCYFQHTCSLFFLQWAVFSQGNQLTIRTLHGVHMTHAYFFGLWVSLCEKLTVCCSHRSIQTQRSI